MNDYQSLRLEQTGQVATVTMLRAHSHEEIADVFVRLRADHSVRAVILTGWDGEFHVPAPASSYILPGGKHKLTDPAAAWRVFSAIVRGHQAMAEIEKPVIAKENGPAYGFGQSLAFACDLIVARADAVFMDHHIGAAIPGRDKSYSNVPGDGGGALIPLFMTPPKAKVYLMLAKAYTGRELEKMGLINYAENDARTLDAKVDEMVQGLLAKGAYTLAWTKRLCNRHVVEQLNRVLDASIGYEMVGLLQREALGGEDPKSL
jgi:enoyl-CoA hydratase/carnithine racemase